MKNKISINDFTFQQCASGHYLIQYTSPKTGNTWVNSTHGTSILERHNLIDLTKNREKPSQKALNELKKFCKKGIINSFIL